MVSLIKFPLKVTNIKLIDLTTGKRIEETGYGFQFPVYEMTDDQLKDAVEKLLNDEEIISKWKMASKRIQIEKRYNAAVEYIFNYA